MQKLDKHDVVIEKVRSLTKGEFKATAIKVELEAHFERPRNGGCESCDDGQRYCNECDGSYEERECGECEGSGRVATNTPEQDAECGVCEGNGEVYCNQCNEGYVECPDCNGNAEDWSRESYCHDWIMEKLSHLGLAVAVPEGESGPRVSQGYESKWRTVAPLMYAEFYRDGSVDSEFTFTLSIANPENVFLLTKFIDIWKDLGEAIGNGISVHRAGMHTALINDPNCLYPSTTLTSQTERFKNFSKSMSLLLPALFFLGSGDEKSRALQFRRPRVAARNSDVSEAKYSAIYYNGGAVEFRVFNTCYDNPEVLLDNIVVIANCMRYWTKKYRPTGLQRITPVAHFGNDNDDSLQRFYCTAQHIDLLNHGLAKLKPSYYTIRDVKRQRNFGVDKRKLNSAVKMRAKQAETEYKEYEERFTWDMLVKKNRWTADFIEHYTYHNANIDRSEVMATVEKEVTERLTEREKTKQSLKKFVETRIGEIEHDNRGQYRLGEA